ncbi:hypothetical protein AY606_15410 [Acinetobacter sp. SFB]|uniref:hypothetical protein n=1 Tax=Acinetobacter sp. SFB TaxID=1805634 RepID=UPI0007D7F7E2|nr:hypothetical protein [Acinetobacter sp. SFB]OAL80405.1 hypothetical protein AY606_15410 [Acinetobacter sp. SFB]
MEITLEQVKSIFEDILNKRITREEADRWAYSVIAASETNSLTIVPNEKRDQVWNGVMYLYGIDLMVNPGEYLHTEEDIIIAMNKKL